MDRLPTGRAFYGALLVALAGGCDGAGVEGDGASSGSSAGCVSNAQCSADNGGLPYLCRNPNVGEACTPLLAEGCTAVFGDFQSDDAVVFGFMASVSGPIGFLGSVNLEGATFALDEIAQALPAGLPAADGDHPVVLVACEADIDPLQTAKHLVHTVGVPAILYAGTDVHEAHPEVAQLTHDAGTLSLLAIVAEPAALQQDSLVWSMTPAYEYARAFQPLLAEVEAAVEADLAVDTIRVAAVGSADALAALDTVGLVFNGQSAVDNAAAGNYQQVSNGGEAAQIAAELAALAPHVILVVGGEPSPWMAALEAGWPAAAPRPRYVFSFRDPGILPLAADSPDLRARVRGVEPVDFDSGPLFQAFAARYQQSGSSAPPDSVAHAYDAAYLLVSASIASGQLSELTGSAIAQGLEALGPPGDLVDMPLDAAAIATTLVGGGDVDVVGVTGPLDFDSTTRRVARDQAVWCVASGSPPEFQSAGQLYSTSTQSLEGSYTPCP